MSRLSALRQVEPVLTELAIGFTNADLVADQLLPFVDIDSEGGKIPLFGKDHFKLYNTERAPRAESNRISPTDVGSITVALEEHDLEYPIDYREDADSAYPLQAVATRQVVEGIRMRHEKTVASMVLNPANFTSGNKIALTGSQCFSDVMNSDPEGVVSDAKAAVRSKVLKEPNTMVIGYAAWCMLQRNWGLKELLSNSRTHKLKISDLREIFEIENIVVGASMFANDFGALGDIWGDNIVLAYVPPAKDGRRNPEEPSFGYTLRRKGNPVVDTRTEDGKLELVRNTDIFRPYLLGADAGYLISNTNA